MLSLSNSNLTDDELLSLLRNSGLQYNISAHLSTHSHPSSSPAPSACYQSPSLELITGPTPQRLLFLLYSLTSLLSVSGNALVLLVHLTSRQRRPGVNMRRYLNNLAVSDITLALLSIPFTYTNLVLGHWAFPRWLCPAAQFAQLLSVFTTSTTLTIIGLERYCVVIHPFSASSLWLTSHTTFLIVATWALGALYSYLPTRQIQTTQFLHHFTAYAVLLPKGGGGGRPHRGRQRQQRPQPVRGCQLYAHLSHSSAYHSRHLRGYHSQT